MQNKLCPGGNEESFFGRKSEFHFVQKSEENHTYTNHYFKHIYQNKNVPRQSTLRLILCAILPHNFKR